MWKMHLHDEDVDSQAANLDLQQSQTLLNTKCAVGCYSTVRELLHIISNTVDLANSEWQKGAEYHKHI